MADETKTNIFDYYSGQAVSADEIEETPVYQAYAFGELEERKFALMFYLADGTLISRPYSHLTEVVCPPPYHQLTLTFTDGTFRCDGTDLGFLVQLLNSATVEALGCFNAEFFIPAVEGEPVITHIGQDSRDVS